MELPKKYDPSTVEDKWYAAWDEGRCFESDPDERTAYTIVIPPPNVTGVLHMGHMLNNTIQDVLIRRARMQGFNACWVPGTDHASIATEAKVVNLLAEKGLTKQEIGREAFLEHAFDWKEKYGGIILQQLKKLGASADWRRTRFTMEESLSEAVIEVFNDLYEKGMIYRGARMVNWDPKGKTTVSDEEVIYTEENTQLYYVEYKLVDGTGSLSVATTRPETIMGDTALAVNPDDERYKDFIGKEVHVPLTERSIKIIGDDYVSTEFGTGALKITPAHDPNDHEIGLRHGLSSIDILDDNGCLNEHAGIFVGEDRDKARKLVAKELKRLGLLQKTEDYMHKVGRSERTHAVIEPKVSTQWFVKMKSMAQKAMHAVESGDVSFHPQKFNKTYFYWLENVKDWCISRQLWWGQQIPAWYLKDGSFVVANNALEALEKARKKSGNDALQAKDLIQDPDVVDTWFSSWLWPISVFDGFKDEKELDYYYPTSTLVTGHDIIFFWVARMIMAGYEFKGKKPFSDVYFTGMVRDKQRRKMSKSLGNSPDALKLIETFGADGTRMGLLMTAAAGNDLLFDESQCEQGRNFCNKLWNSFRLIHSWKTDERVNDADLPAIKWISEKLKKVHLDNEKEYSKFRLSEVMTRLYNFVWGDYCSHFLEMIKPPFGEPISIATKEASLDILDRILRLVHPLMPFISEEIWQTMEQRSEGEFLCTSDYLKSSEADVLLLKNTERVLGLIREVRNVRSAKNISPKEELDLFIISKDEAIYRSFESILKKLLNLKSISYAEKPSAENSSKFIIETDQCYLDIGEHLDMDAERDKLSTELEYQEGFKASVLKKLSNERFVNNAPESVVGAEKKKLADAESRIISLKEALARLN